MTSQATVKLTNAEINKELGSEILCAINTQIRRMEDFLKMEHVVEVPSRLAHYAQRRDALVALATAPDLIIRCQEMLDALFPQEATDESE